MCIGMSMDDIHVQEYHVFYTHISIVYCIDWTVGHLELMAKPYRCMPVSPYVHIHIGTASPVDAL